MPARTYGPNSVNLLKLQFPRDYRDASQEDRLELFNNMVKWTAEHFEVTPQKATEMVKEELCLSSDKAEATHPAQP